MLPRLALVAFTLLSTPMGSRPAVADDTAAIVRFVPSSANAIAVVRVSEILETPRAKREQWDGERAAEFLAGAGLPAWAETLVLASQVRPGHGGELWSLALLPLPPRVDMKTAAMREGGDLTEIAGRAAVVSPRDAFLVPVNREWLAVRRPAVRQEVARWLKTPREARGATEYLREAVGREAHVVLAFDLTDMLDARGVRDRVALLEAARTRPDLADVLRKLGESLRGISLGIRVEETTAAELRLDFGIGVGPNVAPYVKKLFLEVLADHGAAIPELQTAAATPSTKSLVLTTELSDESLRRVLSLILAPHPSRNSIATKGATPPKPGTPAATTVKATEPDKLESTKYFQAVDRVFRSLDPQLRGNDGYLGTATWHDRYADKIDNLPTGRVDPALLKYGESTAKRLRALAASLRGVAVEVDVRQRSVVYDVNVDPGYGGWGLWGMAYRPTTWNVTSNLADVRRKQADAIAGGARERDQIWQMIRDERTAILKAMNAKYDTDMLQPVVGFFP